MSFFREAFTHSCSYEALEWSIKSSSQESLPTLQEDYHEVFSKSVAKNINETRFSTNQYTPIAVSEEQADHADIVLSQRVSSLGSNEKKGFFSSLRSISWKNIFYRLFGRPAGKPLLRFQDHGQSSKVQKSQLSSAISSGDKQRIQGLLSSGVMKQDSIAQVLLQSAQEKQEDLFCYILKAIDAHKERAAIHKYLSSAKTMGRVLLVSINNHCSKITAGVLYSQASLSEEQLYKAFASASRSNNVKVMKAITGKLKMIPPEWIEQARMHAEHEGHKSVTLYLNQLK